MNILAGSVNSGFKFLEATVETQVELVKTAGEGVITVGETVGKSTITVGENLGKGVITIGETVEKGALNVGKSVGEGVLTVGEAVGEGALTVGETVGKGAITVGEGALTVGENVGKGALTVGKTVGKGALVVGETVGEGVISVGESAVNCVNFVDGSVNNLVKMIRMCQNIFALAVRFKEYLEDDSLVESTLALTFWLLVCYFFQIWMIPVGILIIYIKNLIFHYLFGDPEEDECAITQSLKAKVEAIEEIIGLVRALISTLETLLQKIFGFINVKSLHLSWLAILIQVAITFILMFIPINYLLMLWGISLYSKKFLKKKTSPGKDPKNGGKKIVDGTEEIGDAAGDFMSLNFTKGFDQMRDAFGKLSSKSD